MPLRRTGDGFEDEGLIHNEDDLDEESDGEDSEESEEEETDTDSGDDY